MDTKNLKSADSNVVPNIEVEAVLRLELREEEDMDLILGEFVANFFVKYVICNFFASNPNMYHNDHI